MTDYYTIVSVPTIADPNFVWGTGGLSYRCFTFAYEDESVNWIPISLTGSVMATGFVGGSLTSYDAAGNPIPHPAGRITYGGIINISPADTPTELDVNGFAENAPEGNSSSITTPTRC